MAHPSVTLLRFRGREAPALPDGVSITHANDDSMPAHLSLKPVDHNRDLMVNKVG